jgi:hypothetical protein
MTYGLLSLLGYIGLFQWLLILICVTGLFISIGFVHAYLVYEKKAWLKKVLANNNFSEDVKSKLESEVEPVQSFPLYKYFKFYLAAVSVVLIVSGLLTILLSSDSGFDTMKDLVFLPLLIGAIFYFLYTIKFSNNGLFRELTGAFLFSGFAFTFISFFQVYAIGLVRMDVQIYITLGVGLFLISHLNSVITSYLYMVAVIIASTMMSLSMGRGNEWLEYLNLIGDNESLEFLHLFIWPFGLASLLYWRPILESAKRIELREITFGVLFMAVMISLGINNSYGFIALAMLVIIPSLYMFSLTYFKEANWYLEKPIQTAITLLIIYGALIFSDEITVGMFGGYKVYTSGWGVMKVLHLLIIAAIGYFAYTKYEEEFSDKPNSLNLTLLAGLGVFFIASFLGTDLRGDYLVFLYALYLGYDYVTKALKDKNEILVIIGVMIALTPIITKIIELVGSEMNEKIVAGIVMLGIGGIIGGIVVYLRSQWTVTEKVDAFTIDTSNGYKSDVID